MAFRERTLALKRAEARTGSNSGRRTASTQRTTTAPSVATGVRRAATEVMATPTPQGVSGWHRLRVIGDRWVGWWVGWRVWWQAGRQGVGDWWRRQGKGGSVEQRQTTHQVRWLVLQTLSWAAAGEPVVDATAARLTSADAAARAVLLRSTRAHRTDAGARLAVLQVADFVRCNEGLAAEVGELDDSVWDVVLEAFITAKVNPPSGHRWQRPQGWKACQPKGAGSAASRVRNLLRRLGYITTDLARLGLATQALGCGDVEDVVRALPVFTWQVCAGIRKGTYSNAWEMCARAMVVLGVLAAGRKGTVTALLVEQLVLTQHEHVVIVRPKARPKQHRARATQRARRQAPSLCIDHWLVAACVVPWFRRLQAWGANGSQKLFPSLVRQASVRVSSVNGRLVDDGLWMEPTAEWSARAVGLGVDLVVGSGEGTFQSLRSGNNIELRRLRDGTTATSDVTRRTLHGRTVRDLIGSEVAYNEVFVEDLCGATSLLGSLRIERTAAGLSVTGTSASCGRHNDWVATQRQALVPLLLDECVDSSDSSSGDDGGIDPALAHRGAIECGRCGKLIPKAGHGFMCDRAGCAWGVCLTCHTGGVRRALLCPAHTR